MPMCSPCLWHISSLAMFHIIALWIFCVGVGQIYAHSDDVLETLDLAYVLEDTELDNNTLSKKCTSRPADIVFLLDSSSSEGINHFNEQIKFVSNITKAFTIGPSNVQISVVTYSEATHNEFFLNEYHNKTNLLSAINSIQYQPGNTQTDDGLAFVFHVSFLPQHGGRNNSDRIIIVLTDGESTDTKRTKAVADAIHSTDIRVISIGIGELVDKKELLDIATDSSTLYYVANFTSLSNIVVDVTKQTCFNLCRPYHEGRFGTGSVSKAIFVQRPSNTNATGLLCASTPADILFLLGTSSDVGSASFSIQLEFVKNFTKAFEIGPDAVQIAVATFTNTTEADFWFGDYGSKTDVLAGIDTVQYRAGDIVTQEALKFAREDAFTEDHGARNDSRHIVILMTDSQSSDKSQISSEALSLHNSGVFVITIGIGNNVDQKELKDIATGSGDKNFFAASNFEALHTIELTIEGQTCKYATGKHAQSTRPADVVFLLDTSNSEGANNFYKQLDFVSNFANRLIIGRSNVQISIVTFSSDAQLEFTLGQYTTKESLIKAIGGVAYRPGDTQTDNGLHFVSQNSFKPENGARDNANQVLIVVTDGQSTEPVSTALEAERLHNRGIKVISVGIGVQIDSQELHNIASGDEFVFTVADFNALVKIEEDIIETTCKANVTECSTEPREIVFLLDSSTSEGSANFQKQLKFVSTFVDGFDIGPDAVQVSVVTFSSSTTNRFWLNDFNSKAALQAAILGIPYSSGQTHTGLGLEFVRRMSLSPEHGARADSRKVVIVMTDGQSQQKLLTANQGILLRKAGVKVISVGIGQGINLGELAVIASDDKHMFKVSSFDDLASVEIKLQDRVCSKLVCASTPADIMFVLDTSSSIGPVNFHDMLDFITNFVRKFDVGTSAVQFGIITFSNDVYPQFDLGKYTDKGEVIAAIGRILYHYGGTYTEKALNYIRKNSFTPSHGARSEAEHIAIVLTDGQSQSIERTKEAAESLHDSGVEVLAVGIGSAVNPTELSYIGTNESYVFSVATFDALDTIQTELLQATCSSQAPVIPATKKPGPCGEGDKADVIFLLDASNSEGPEKFQDELRFVEKFVDDFTIGPDDYQFGIITFASNARLWLTLNGTSSESQLRLAMLQVAYEGGLSYTSQGLELARTDGFTEENGARPGVSRFLVIVTDGESTQPLWTAQEADLLKQESVHIITVGVDVSNATEINTIASDINSVFQAKSFDDLPNYVSDVQKKICSQSTTSPTPTSAVMTSTASPVR